MRPVFVIEDDPHVRDLLVDALREADLPVFSSDEGRKALELAAAARPSVILLDLAMEGMDGWTFLEHRREQPALADVPVVLITGSAVEPRLDVAAILRKPLNIDEVLATVRRLRRAASR